MHSTILYLTACVAVKPGLHSNAIAGVACVAWTKTARNAPANRNARSKQWQPWLAACQRKHLRFLRFSFTQRKRLRLNGNRAWLWLCGVRRRLVTYSKCFRELDLDDNLIGELGGFEIMRALTKREQRTSVLLYNAPFTPDTCSPDTSCIHLYPLSPYTCILYRRQNCRHGYMYPLVSTSRTLLYSVDM